MVYLLFSNKMTIFATDYEIEAVLQQDQTV
jgi:hypothetical protein